MLRPPLLHHITNPENHEEYAKYYWKQLTDAVGCDGPGLPSCDHADFFKLIKFRAFLGGLKTLKLINNVVQSMGGTPELWDTVNLADCLTPFLGALDETVIDYFAQKTKNLGSAFLDLSQYVPDSAVLKALSERELSMFRHELPMLR